MGEKEKKTLAATWVSETSSVGRLRSRKDAPEISHLLIGAQKCTVKGPAAALAKVLHPDAFQRPVCADEQGAPLARGVGWRT